MPFKKENAASWKSCTICRHCICWPSTSPFSAFGADKRRAGAILAHPGKKALFLLSLLGGSAGALLGMRIFHLQNAQMVFRFTGIPPADFTGFLTALCCFRRLRCRAVRSNDRLNGRFRRSYQNHSIFQKRFSRFFRFLLSTALWLCYHFKADIFPAISAGVAQRLGHQP